MDEKELRQRVLEAASDDDPARLDALIALHPEIPAMAGKVWEQGFVPDAVTPEIARRLVDRGAPLTIHAASAFGLVREVARFLDADSSAVHLKGGDGCTPLHFARDVRTAELLLERGAEIDARDDDHNSTPAQWRIGKAPEVVRLLLERGATPDIFLAAALGDIELAEELIGENPDCTGYRIGKLPEFPPIGFESRGGTIYQWTLAFNSYPHQVALLRGHPAMFDLLYGASSTEVQLLVNCVLARRHEAEAIAARHPEIVPSLSDADRELVARYCWETNSNLEAVRLMLDLGFPLTHPERSHGYTPLHNAAWEGNADLVDLLLARGHPVDIVDPGYEATPLGFAFYDHFVEKRHPEGQFTRVVDALLEAGSPWDKSRYPTGDSAIDAVLAKYVG